MAVSLRAKGVVNDVVLNVSLTRGLVSLTKRTEREAFAGYGLLMKPAKGRKSHGNRTSSRERARAFYRKTTSTV
ncbi:MAG: hypothetical protein EON98_08210 [Chitinophagaceae bacterium]|nr:MAG: hypothetical protein EON98_08210 [Chitinophagaceae bacterium]